MTRWIVDGMNVIGSRPDGWWKDRGAAMARLVDALERWAANENASVAVVFEKPPDPPLRSSVITVAHAAHAAPNSADDEIVAMVQAAEEPTDIRVVTSDGALTDRVTELGAEVHAAKAFRELIER